MNLRAVRLDAKQALRENRRPAIYDTLIYFGLTNFLALVISLLYFSLDQAVAGTGGGLGAANARSAYSFANTALYVLSIVVNISAIFLSFGYNAVMLLRVRRQQVGAKSIWIGFRMLGRVLALSLLQMLHIVLWSFLFVIPGLIAVYRYRLAIFILFDDPSIPPSMALRASSRLASGHKRHLLALDLSFWYYYALALLSMLLANIDTYNLFVEFYALELPVFDYTQTLAIYAAGILLLGAAQLWKLPHVTASTAGFYHRLRIDDEMGRTELYTV